jgi:hypothetical protein
MKQLVRVEQNQHPVGGKQDSLTFEFACRLNLGELESQRILDNIELIL